MKKLMLGIPSKGRLMEAASEMLHTAGYPIERLGSERGYRGLLKGIESVDVAFLSASEIAQNLKDGQIDFGITGEDLLREKISPDDTSISTFQRLGFGGADVVVAIPQCWVDVATMADLDDVSAQFYIRHGRRLRVATKYNNITRRFFAHHGVTGYRTVESLGATEGAIAAGIAEVIVDITTTGSTLAANHLRVLDDGLVLKSCAVLCGQSVFSTEPRIVTIVNQLRVAQAQPQ